ncbi:MAG: DUF4367 domain-containing protein [Eubacterium sp.]
MDNFTQACIISNSRWVQGLEAESGAHTFSKAHEKAMKRIIGSMEGGSSRKISRIFIAALIAAIIIAITCLTVMGIPQTYDYTITQKADSAYYEVVCDKSERPKNVKSLKVGYVPEGFELVNSDEDNLGYLYCYYNCTTDSEINISKDTFETKYQFDNEEFSYETVEHNGVEYIVYRADETTGGVIWNSNGYVYCITSTDLSREELIKIAKNVK